jgi:hypothetical protein
LLSPSSVVVLQRQRQRQLVVVTFFVFEKKKNMTTISITFFDGFVAKTGDNKCHSLFLWFCYEKGDGNNVITYFYGGGVVKKAMAMAMNCHRLLSLFIFLLL